MTARLPIFNNVLSQWAVRPDDRKTGTCLVDKVLMHFCRVLYPPTGDHVMNTNVSSPLQQLSESVVAFIMTLLLVSPSELTAAKIHVPQDQPTIQAGIDVATAGDVILVAAGTYQERIRLKPGVTVRSAGDDAKGKVGLRRAEETVIDGNIKGATVPGVTMAEDSTLDGFSVTGIGTYDEDRWNRHHASQGEEQAKEPIGAPGTAGIAAGRVSRCTVTNNIVHHIGYTGIAIEGEQGKRVSPHIFRNVTYRNMGGGIGSMRGSTAIIEENVCFENFYAGIGHEGAAPLVINNTCHSNVRAGIGISEGACPTVRGNRCFGNRRAGIGVRTESTTSPIIEDNDCYENDMAGIGAREDSTPIIRHNRCYKNALAGIGCRTKARPIIEHNECYENGMAGIGCRTEAEPVIRFNKCHDNEAGGIGSQLKARPVIVGNECYTNQMAGIGTESEAAAIIHANTCYRNQMAGIGARQGAQPIIEGNRCYENVLAGIGSEDKSVPVIRNNECISNKQAGIGIQTGTQAVIVDNVCRENALSGIGVREAAAGILIRNQCLENKMVAIGVRNASTILATQNTLVRTGGMPPMVAVREDSTAVFRDNTVRGGGVAGVMVQGSASISGNRFEGNGPRKGGPPNFAVWVHGGSTVTFTDNQTDRWRHALFASGAKQVYAKGNTTSQFFGTAIVVKDSNLPAHVFGNVALSDNADDKAVQVTGPPGIVANNSREATEQHAPPE